MNDKNAVLLNWGIGHRGIQLFSWLGVLALGVCLVIVSFYNYLLFHSLIELFAIIVAITMSIVAWQMYPLTRNNFLMSLGCGYFWVAILDLLHTLSYRGMGVFPSDIPDLAIQLWIGARYCEASLLLSAPFFLNRPFNRIWGFLLYGLIAAGLCLWIFSGRFPVTYIEDQGLTAFKVYSEYFIIGLLALALYYLWNRRAHLEVKIVRLMALSILLTMCAELAFTFYVSFYGLSNLVGHVFKLVSFFLIFTAVVRTTLREPFLALSRGASTYDAVPDAAIVVDDKGIIRQVNRAACALIDRAENSLLGQNAHEMFHPQALDSDQCLVCCMQRSGETGGPVELELPESNKWYDYTLSEISAKSGVQGMVQAIRDITPRKKAEQELQLSRKRLKFHLENTPLGIIEWDNDFCVISWNKSAERIFGYSEQEAIGKHANLILSKDSLLHVDEVWKSLQNNSGGERSTNVNKIKDGRLIHCDWYNTPLTNEAGEVTGVASMVMDITERHNSEQQLEKNYQLSQAMTRTLSVYVSGSEADDRVIFEDMLGVMLNLTESEYGFIGEIKFNDEGTPYLITKAITNIAWNETTQRLYEKNATNGLRFDNLNTLFGAVMTSGAVVIASDPANDPRRGGVPEGHPPLNAFMGIPLYLGGEILGMVGIANRPGGYDKTVAKFLEPICQTGANVIAAVRAEKHRQQAQQELRKYRDQLEDLVEERTTLLQHSTTELEVSNKELESFSYSVSHDLRAPLRAIDGFSQAIDEEFGEVLGTVGQDYLLRVRRAAQRMGDLIDDLLELSRVSRSQLKPRAVNLSEIAQEVISALKEAHQDRQVECVIMPDLIVNGDPVLLKVMLDNLLANAWKYTAKVDAPRIELGMEKLADENVYYIKDNGVGFDMKYAGKLFGAFQRLHKADEYEGSGVGLATVTRILHRHGGRIWAESELGKGAAFYFVIP